MSEDPVPEQARPFAEPRRTHPLTPALSGWFGLVVAAGFVGQQVVQDGFNLDTIRALFARSFILGAAVVMLLVSVVSRAIGWWFVQWHLAPDGLVITSTFLTHTHTRVMYKKVQSVDIRQPFAARLFGLCEVTIEVGGDANQSLRYLSRSDAEQVRMALLDLAARAKSLNAASLPPRPTTSDERPEGLRDGAPTGGAPTPTMDAVMPAAFPVTRVTWGQQALGAFTSGSLLGTLVVIAVIGGVTVWLGEPLAAGFLIPVALPAALDLFKKLVREGNFRVEATSHGLRISCGLTDLSTSTTPVDRVHGFSIKQSMLGRLTGLWRVEMTVLGNTLGDDTLNSTALSYGTWQQVSDVVHAVWPSVDLDAVPLQHVPERAKWFLWWARPKHVWGMTDQVAMTRSGMIATRIEVLDHPRAQGITLQQGPLDRRLGLAAVHFHTVAGPLDVHFTHLDVEDAIAVTASQPRLAREIRQRRRAGMAGLADAGRAEMVASRDQAGPGDDAMVDARPSTPVDAPFATVGDDSRPTPGERRPSL